MDVVTLYLCAANQDRVAEDILQRRPRRVVFNPGAENTLVHAEPGVPPRAHLPDGLGGDLTLVHEKLEHFMLPELQERLDRDRRQKDEAPVWSKRPVGDYGMDVRVPVRQLPKGLDCRDHSRNRVIATENRLIGLADQVEGDFGQFPEKFTVEPEIYPQPFRDSKHELAVRDVRENVLANVH